MRPVLFLLFTLFYKALDRKRSPLTPEERSLLMVRISNLNHCAFCIDLNSFNLLNRSGNGEKLDRLPNWRTESLYSNRERALLAFTDAVTRNENTEEAVAG
jgi:AhpD family alkylhydroperoxidase